MAFVDSFGVEDEVFFSLGGGNIVWTGYEMGTVIVVFPSASVAGTTVDVDLELPADAVIQHAYFGVAAEPVVPARIDSVATVRAASPISAEMSACTIDFGRLVTVSGVTSDGSTFIPSIDRIRRWTGADWELVSTSAFFAEIATERLLVETEAVTTQQLVDSLSSVGAVNLPAIPSALELQVNGVTVWFERQGGSPIDLDPPPVTGAGSRYVVDRTVAIADAFAQAAATEGAKTVRVTLRAAAPGRLTLAPSVAALRVHTVNFLPEGLVRTLDLLEEGLVTVDVTPPDAEDVRQVAAVVRGSFGPERVQPPIGPALTPDAHLVLAPARPVLIGLPDGLTSRFGKLTGVRLVLRAVEHTNGGEVTGRLLSDAGGHPGPPLPGGDLTSLSVGPGPEAYATLRFAEALDPPAPLGPAEPPAPGGPPRISCWLELQLGHGAVECAFTGADPNDPVAPGGLILRRLPGGGTAELTEIPTLGPLRAALRVVGTADRDRPIPAVGFSVRGSADGVGVNPTADDLTTQVTLAAPLAVSGPVFFDAVAAAPGTLTLDTVRVTYKELA